MLPLCSAFHQPQGRVKYASSEGNVPYLCPSGDKFIAPSTIYNPSEPWWSGLCYLSCRGTAMLMILLLWGPNKGARQKKKKKGKKRKTRGGSKNIFVSCVRFCSPHMIHLSCFTMIWLKSPKMACLKELNTKKYCSLNHESRCIPVGLPGITKHASWDNLMFLPHCHDMKSHSAKATLQRRYNGL